MANIYDYNNSPVGKVDSDGIVYNSNNSPIGKVDSDGIVYNSNNSPVGKVDQFGNVYNSNNSYVGKVGSDGIIYDYSNSPVGKTESRVGGSALLLLNNPQRNYSSSPPPLSGKEGSEAAGCIIEFLSILGKYIFFLLKSNWGGRIGIILGVVFSIILFSSNKNTNMLSEDTFASVVICIIMLLLLGTVGAIIGAIIGFIHRRPAGIGKTIMIALFSLALLAGIAGIAYKFVIPAWKKAVAAEAAEKAETGEAREVGAAKEAGAAEGDVLRDSRDGKEYKTIRIGSQTWLAGNLNLEASGSACYDNNPANCAKYGRLYSWAAAMGACPSGWRLPSGNEWERLANNAGYNPGKKLKSSEWGGADGYGFLALPGGLNSGGKFSGIGSIGLWWSATEHDAGNAFRYIMDGSHDNMDKFHNDKARLLSVRCVKD